MLNIDDAGRIIAFLVISGCQGLNAQPITDKITPTEPKTVEVKDGMYTIEYHSDSMVRRKLNYLSKEHGKIDLNPNEKILLYLIAFVKG